MAAVKRAKAYLGAPVLAAYETPHLRGTNHKATEKFWYNRMYTAWGCIAASTRRRWYTTTQEQKVRGLQVKYHDPEDKRPPGETMEQTSRVTTLKLKSQ